VFYRRKLLSGLLQLFDWELNRTQLQHLLFLSTQSQTRKDYDFVPERIGPCSYSATADITIMASRGLLSEDGDLVIKHDPSNFLVHLKSADLAILQTVKNNHGEKTLTELMRFTFLNFPFYAINSTVAREILTHEELQKVEASKPHSDQTILFTIGYEGISLEEYLVRLIKNDVKVLIDVRNNPLSMKFGFSKNQLKKFCGNVGIDYVHIPEVGIRSEQRKELSTRADFDKLFASYREEILPQTVTHQTEILNLLIRERRIALTCFEANIEECHRKYLGDAIEKLPNFKYKVQHI
jgi:uncharacterized protein (DUF488 family)